MAEKTGAPSEPRAIGWYEWLMDSVVADKLGVSPKDVYEWRQNGWKGDVIKKVGNSGG